MPITSVTARLRRSCSSASAWGGRCSSKARPASARPRSPRSWPGRSGGRLIRLQCYEGLDTASAVYEWNYAGQMMAIRLAEAGGDIRIAMLSQGGRFLRALPHKAPAAAGSRTPNVDGAPILLIDELDRADEAFEAYLLEVLSDFQITIPETRDDQGGRAADRDHHVEPHPGDPRRPEAALPVPLGGLPRC